ncbi:MAG: terminase [Terriglobia bacterium]
MTRNLGETALHQTPNSLLVKEVRQFYGDPLGFVMMAYPWKKPGTELEHESGPDDTQKRFLIDLGKAVRARRFNGADPVMPILMTMTAGHGTGKSVMGAWIADWILSTRPDSIGTVTAGTFTQLESRTWAAIQHWTKLCITAPWFHIQQHGIFHKMRPKTWKVVAQTCKEENAQSFAGQHARTSTSWYMFDEASLVPDTVWTVAQGGLTDGEPMFFAWGQCERNTGRFYEINFGSQAHRWNHRTIDSRESRFTNKQLIERDVAEYGIESDYVRVRIRGLAPNADELQFIDRTRILAAQQRQVVNLPDEPLIAGFDASGGGSAWNVVRFRRGMDGRSIPPLRVPGELSRDREALITRLAGIMQDQRPEFKVAVMFVDSAYGAPYVERLHVLGYANVIEVNFGAPSLDRHQANMRAYMWNQVREWLPHGAIPAEDEKLALDLSGPGAKIRVTTNQLVLESKADMQARGLASPDDGDALALTFAQPVVPEEREERDEEEEFVGVRRFSGSYSGARGWMR